MRPSVVQLGAQVEHLDLVRDVEERGRLVEQQRSGLLGERHRDPDPLALAAGQFVDQPVGQVGDPGRPHRRPRTARSSCVGPLPQQPLVRVAAAGHQVGDGDAVGRDRGLRQQPEPPGDFLAPVCGDPLPSSSTAPAPGLSSPGQRPQQRGLAAGVRADDHGERVGRDLQVERLGHRPAVVGERDPGRASLSAPEP